MVRSLVTPKSTELHISIPDDYVGKKVEILVFAYEETIEETRAAEGKMEQFWGIISEETTAAMHKHVALSRGEWERDIY